MSCSVSSSGIMPIESPFQLAQKVFIFDIEDITMLSDRQIEKYAQKFPEFPIRSMSEKLELLKSEVEYEDSINEGVVDDGSKSSKMNALRKAYDMMSAGPSDEISSIIKDFQGLHIFSDRWNRIRQSLKLINRISRESHNRKYEIVVICRDGVARCAIQLLMASLASEIKFNNIYSTARKSDEEVLNEIMNRFGGSFQFLLVTSKEEIIEIAENRCIPVCEVETNDDFDDFFDRINGYHLLEKPENLQTATEQFPVKQKQEHAAQDQVKIMEKMEQPIVVQMLAEVKIKTEPIKRKSDQISNPPLKKKRISDETEYEELDRFYPIPPRQTKEEKAQEREQIAREREEIARKKEEKRKTQERRQVLKIIRRAKAALLGKGMMTRKQAREAVERAPSEQIQEEVSAKSSSSQEQLEPRMEEMEQDQRENANENRVQSSDPVNVAKRGRRKPKAQLQKSMDRAPSDLAQECNQKQAREFNEETLTQDPPQEESTPSRPQLESTVRSEETIVNVSFKTQTEFHHPSTSKSLSEKELLAHMPAETSGSVLIGKDLLKDTKFEPKTKLIQYRNVFPLENEAQTIGKAETRFREAVTSESSVELVEAQDEILLEYEAQDRVHAETAVDQSRANAPEETNDEILFLEEKVKSPQMLQQVIDQQVHLQQQRQNYNIEDRLEKARAAVARSEQILFKYTDNELDRLRKEKDHAKLAKFHENRKKAEKEYVANLLVQREAQSAFNYQEVSRKFRN